MFSSDDTPSPPFVSVIIPALNEAEFIEAAIKSASCPLIEHVACET